MLYFDIKTLFIYLFRLRYSFCKAFQQIEELSFKTKIENFETNTTVVSWNWNLFDAFQSWELLFKYSYWNCVFYLTNKSCN